MTELVETRKKLKVDYVLGDIRSLLSESSEGAERVRAIVQNLKSFSRIDEAQSKEVDLNDCLESTISIAWNELKYKTTLIRDYGELPLVSCYPQQLNQVFLNLLVNAAHAIDKQGEITIKTWQDGDCVCVAVSDTGCGIPDEVRNRIFEPFFTTKEVGKGTGLGLSISYDIVKKHNGTIEVTSTSGQGTTFTVRLPIRGE
jgi:two-component system NtrC family sensor kinase